LCDCSVGCRWPWGTHRKAPTLGTWQDRPTCRGCGYYICSCPPRPALKALQRKGWHRKCWVRSSGYERDDLSAAVWGAGHAWDCGPRTSDRDNGYNRGTDWGAVGLGSAEEAMDWVEVHLPAEGTRTFKMTERMYTATELVNLKMPLSEKHELVRRYEAAGAITPGQAAYIINGDWHR